MNLGLGRLKGRNACGGVAVGGGVGCLIVHILDVFVGIVDFLESFPIDLHAGILVTRRSRNVKHDRHKNVAEGGLLEGVILGLGGNGFVLVLYHDGGHVKGQKVGIRLIHNVEIALFLAEACGTELVAVEFILRIGIVISVVDYFAVNRFLIGESPGGIKHGFCVVGVGHSVLGEAAGIYSLKLHHEAVHSEIAHGHEFKQSRGLAVLHNHDGTVLGVLGLFCFVAFAASEGGVTHRIILGVACVFHVDVGIIYAVGNIGGYAHIDCFSGDFACGKCTCKPRSQQQSGRKGDRKNAFDEFRFCYCHFFLLISSLKGIKFLVSTS